MDISLIVKIHAILVLISILVYVIRGGLMVADSAAVNSKLLLAAASTSMLLLFITGIAAVVVMGMPFTSSYVILKVVGLVLYVGLGIAALKPGLAKGTSIILWILGLAALVYTFMMAKGMMPILF